MATPRHHAGPCAAAQSCSRPRRRWQPPSPRPPSRGQSRMVPARLRCGERCSGRCDGRPRSAAATAMPWLRACGRPWAGPGATGRSAASLWARASHGEQVRGPHANYRCRCCRLRAGARTTPAAAAAAAAAAAVAAAAESRTRPDGSGRQARDALRGVFSTRSKRRRLSFLVILSHSDISAPEPPSGRPVRASPASRWHQREPFHKAAPPLRVGHSDAVCQRRLLCRHRKS